MQIANLHPHTTPLEILSEKEWLLLCTRAEVSCVELAFRLARTVTFSDPKLSDLLIDLGLDERSHLRRIQSYDDKVQWPLVWHLSEPAVRDVLQAHLPTLSNSHTFTSEKRADILAVFENVERESARFYRTLVGLAEGSALGSLFSELAEEETAHIGTFAARLA